MRIGRVLGPDGPRLVVADGDHAVDVRVAETLRRRARGARTEAADRVAAALFPGSLSEAAAAGPLLLEALAEAAAFGRTDGTAALLPMEDLRFLPVADPRVMRDFMTFETHIVGAGRALGREPGDAVYELPIYYKGNPTSLLAHGDEVPWPSYTELMDYELELGFVVGAGGRDLIPEESAGALLGVTIFGDFSARDIQRQEMAGGLGPAKSKDFGTALGPWITTLDELDLTALPMTVRVNGEERSSGVSGTMMWSPEEIVAWASTGEDLHPGDVIGSGTVGEGCGLELGRYLDPGDVVELDVGGIGVLRNTIGSPLPRRWYPTPKPRTIT